MGLRCFVCQHKDVDAINLACVEGVGSKDIAKTFGISQSNIDHHRKSGHAARAITAQVLAAHNGPLSELAQVAIASKTYRVRALDELFIRVRGEIAEQPTGALDPKLVREAVGILSTAAKEMGEWKPDGGEKADATRQLAQSVVIHALSNAAPTTKPVLTVDIDSSGKALLP